MEQFLNPRLKVYHKILNKYDIVDKEFPFTVVSINKLKNITLLYHTDKIDDSSFSTLLDIEFLTYKRIGLVYKSKNQLKIINFLVTLRNISLYLYLELFMHSYFFTKNNLLNQNQNSLTFIFTKKNYNSFLSTKFMFNINNYSFDSKNTSVALIFKYLNNSNLAAQLSYYFIPALK